MPVIMPDKKILYDSIFNSLHEDMIKKIDALIQESAGDEALIIELNKSKEENSESIQGMSKFANILTDAIEKYVSSIVVEINPGIPVHINVDDERVMKGKTVSKGSSAT